MYNQFRTKYGDVNVEDITIDVEGVPTKGIKIVSIDDDFNTIRKTGVCVEELDIETVMDIISHEYREADWVKKAQIKQLTMNMFKGIETVLSQRIDKVLNSGAVDISGWDMNHNPMLLPKAIFIAFLRDEAEQYTAKGTSFEKQMKEEVENISNIL